MMTIPIRAVKRGDHARTPRSPRAIGGAVGCLWLLALVVADAAAFTTVSAPFTMATDLATGFDTCGAADGGGPIPGIDDGTHIFIADLCDRKTYVWGENGGTTSNALLSVTNGLNHGLAISGGVYYGTDSDGAGTGTAHGSVWTFDPNTLALGTLIATIS